jgi:TonB family protein
MNSGVDRSPKDPTRPRFQLWLVIGLVFCAQIGLIFALSDYSPVRARPASRVPALHLASLASPEMLALDDPTLFALPHHEGFSGLAWLSIPPQKFPSFDWSEPPRWLPLFEPQLGEMFQAFMKTNHYETIYTLADRPPTLTLPEIPRSSIAREASELRLEGGLARRRLLTTIQLPAWPHPDFLSNSIVQLAVDPTGHTLSATLLSSSGSKAADQHALEQARAARFNSIEENGPGRRLDPLGQLNYGLMIFEWQTVAPEVK